MSKLVDTIKAFAASESGDAITVAVKGVQDARAVHAKLYEQGQSLQSERRQLEVKLGNVALDDPGAFDALDKELQKLLAKHRQNSAAQEAASARLQEAQHRLHQVTNSDFLHKIEKKMRLTERQAEEVEQAEQNYIAKTNLLIKGRRELSAVIQARGTMPPLGMALDGNAVLDLIALDLFRLNPVGVLSSGDQYKTPGAVSGVLRDAAKIVPLPDAIRQTNAALLDKLKAAPVAPAEIKPTPEVEATDPDAAILDVPTAPKSETRLNAAEIMAALPKGKRTTLDNRSKR